MIFCQKCGALMKPKAEKGKKVLACSCGFVLKNPETKEFKEEVVQEEKKVEVVSEEPETLPLMDADCSKCGHNQAYYWLVQTRAGDEAETKFLKCEKCKHTWREYD